MESHPLLSELVNTKKRCNDVRAVSVINEDFPRVPFPFLLRLFLSIEVQKPNQDLLTTIISYILHKAYLLTPLLVLDGQKTPRHARTAGNGLLRAASRSVA